MKIKRKYHKKPLMVYAINWLRSSKDRIFKYEVITTFTVFSDPGLEELYEKEFTIVDNSIDDFVIVPEFDKSSIVLMWKPLFELNNWEALREYDPIALEQIRELRRKHGHDTE